MTQISLDEQQVKELFKQAVRELFLEQRDLIYDVFCEALEDLALVEAIREGHVGDLVPEQEIFALLEQPD